MSDHIPDLTKMIGETPRTDKVTRTYGDASVEWEEELVPVDACRAIERELNAANERIKRLEEVGDEVVINYVNSLSAFEMWRKAKEAKP